MKLMRLLPAALLLVSFAAAEETVVPELHGITLVRVAAATRIADRQPVGEAEAFPAEVGRVYCFTKVNGARIDTKITHVWLKGGEEQARVDLPVRSISWRTWSSKKIPAEWAGDWKVIVLDDAGNEIGSTAFTVGG